MYIYIIYLYKLWVCLKIVYPFLPNGFADHYPKNKWLFHWEYTLFSDKNIFIKLYKCIISICIIMYYIHDITDYNDLWISH